MTDRAQAHTLEAIVASLLLLGSLVYALQVTAVTPLSASTSSQQIENEQQARAEGLLAVTAQDGSLKRALLYWDPQHQQFNCVKSGPGYRGPPESGCGVGSDTDAVPPNEFGVALSNTFGTGVAVNVITKYRTENGSVKRRPLIYRGEPTDNAVHATTTVVLFDNDSLLNAAGAPTSTTLGSSSKAYFAPDAYTSTESKESAGLYNVIQVEVIVWRI